MKIYKRIIFIFLLLLSTVSASTLVNAQTASPTPAKEASTPLPTKSAVDTLSKQINTLKDKIASRVAELRLVEKRGFYGTVTQVSGTQMTVNDLGGNTRIIDVDEITKFSSPTSKTYGISDVTKGTLLSVLGLYNKESRRTLARFVNVETVPSFLNGQISSIDEDEFTITVVTEEEKSTTVDIENITRTNAYTEEDGVEKSGFSQLALNDRVVVVGYVSKTDKTRVTASRILILEDLPKNPNIKVTGAVDSAETTTTPSPSRE